MSQKPEAKVTRITPAAAQKLLRDNVMNRPLSRGRVSQYAKAMKENRWLLNGDTIVLDKKGRLLNGQHRLHACIQSDTAFPVILVTGISPDAFSTIDQGKVRTGGDIFSVCGVTNASTVAAALTVVYQTMKGIPEGSKHHTPDMDERVKLFDQMPGCEDRVKEVMHYRGHYRGMPVAMLCGLYCSFWKKSQPAARAFLHELAHGINGAPNPAFALRKKLGEISEAEFRPGKQAIAALIKTTWNAFVSGAEIQEAEIPATLDIQIMGVSNDRWWSQ